jgi:glycosyltransferase involved in cell wall biosynthesis
MAFVGKRVLMLVENMPYPQDIRVIQEASTLSRSGYSVSIICRRSPGQPWHETIDGVRVFRYPSPGESRSFIGYLWEYGYSLLAAFLLSIAVCISPGFDIIHAANPPDTFVFIAIIYKLFGKRFIFDHHDLVPELYSLRFRGKATQAAYHLAVWMERLSCRTADCVIATNQSYKDIDVKRGNIPEERVVVVRNGPPTDRFHPIGPDAGLRRKSRAIIGYVGNMAAQDGVDYLLRALQKVIVDLSRTDFFVSLLEKVTPWQV